MLDAAQLSALAPVGILGLGILVLILLDAISAPRFDGSSKRETEMPRRYALAITTCIALICSMLFTPGGLLYLGPGIEIPRSLMMMDSLASLAFRLIAVAALLVVLLAHAYLPKMGMNHGDFYPLLLLSVLGAFAAVSSGNLLSLFLGLEIMSLPIYVLAGFDRDRAKSNEAGLKAHLIGILSSAIMLYGIALLYGATGRMDYSGIAEAFASSRGLAMAGFGLVAVGLLTRVYALPFHQWIPDVSDGAPAPVSAFLSVTLVSAGFVSLIRLCVSVLPDPTGALFVALRGMAVASLFLGALLALTQSNVKRMIAYAGISHTGFLLAGLSMATTPSRAALLFYLIAFVFMQMGAYGSIAVLARGNREHESLADYSGLARRRPILAAAMGLFLMALAGFPGTSGFMGRFILMSTALETNHLGMALMMALTSVALFASYLRVLSAMYMGQHRKEDTELIPIPAVIALVICASVTLYLGIFPGAGPLDTNVLAMIRAATP